jgi:hypothetical protein
MGDMVREVRLGLQRFWALRWAVKGPIMGFVALVAISGVGAALDSGPKTEDDAAAVGEGSSQLTDDATEATATESTATPAPTAMVESTPEPMPEPTQAPFITVSEPADGASVCALSPVVAFRGSALPGAVVKRGDQKATADASGQWAMELNLKEGENKLKFELDDDDDIKHEIRVTYCLPANADKAEDFLVILNQVADPLFSDSCQAQPGNRLVAVNVTVRNADDGTHAIYYDDFELRDSNGIQWEPYKRVVFGSEVFVLCTSPSLESVDLEGGGEITGWVSFEVRADSMLTEVYYDPNIFTKEDVHIKLR